MSNIKKLEKMLKDIKSGKSIKKRGRGGAYERDPQSLTVIDTGGAYQGIVEHGERQKQMHARNYDYTYGDPKIGAGSYLRGGQKHHRTHYKDYTFGDPKIGAGSYLRGGMIEQMDGSGYLRGGMIEQLDGSGSYLRGGIDQLDGGISQMDGGFLPVLAAALAPSLISLASKGVGELVKKISGKGRPKKHNFKLQKQDVGGFINLLVPLLGKILGAGSAGGSDDEVFVYTGGSKPVYLDLGSVSPFTKYRQAAANPHFVATSGKGKTKKQTGGKTKAKRTNPWLQHVGKVRKDYPGRPYKEILQLAKQSY